MGVNEVHADSDQAQGLSESLAVGRLIVRGAEGGGLVMREYSSMTNERITNCLVPIGAKGCLIVSKSDIRAVSAPLQQRAASSHFGF